MAKKQPIFIPSTSGNNVVMNNTLSDYMAGRTSKVKATRRVSKSRAGKKIHGWQITIETH